MKRSWFSRHPICFMALYLLFYLSAFNFLETRISMPHMVLVHCRLDDLIPFCKYAVIPYFAWFVWIPFTLFYLLWRAPREDFWRLCLPLFAGMTIALACYVILPTGLALRPYYVPGNAFFARTVRTLYRTDTPTNVCPSIHVFNSVTLLLAYYRSRIFDAPRRRWMRPAATVLCVSIVCSTVLLKQHSCIDVALGALRALALDVGLQAPEFAHCPLLLAPDGRRLSKRDGDQSLENLREKYTAQEIVGKLAYAYGLQPEPAPRTPESLVSGFSWAKVPKQDVCLPEGLF